MTQVAFLAHHAALAARPSLGPSAGGTTVTLEGAALPAGAALRCLFGARPAALERRSLPAGGAAAVCVAPPGTANEGAAEIAVVAIDSGVTLGRAPFRYHEPPVPAQLRPSLAPLAGGGIVTVVGAGFASGLDTASVLCRFGADGPTAPARWLSSSALSCVAPPAAAPGVVALAVSLNAGADFSAPSGARLAYLAPSALTALVPATLPAGAAGAAVVTLIGAGFAQLQELEPRCRLGRAGDAAAVVVSDSRLLCTVPAQAEAGATLAVAVSADGWDEPLSAALPLSFFAPGGAAALAPSQGPVLGGTVVTVSGVDLAARGALSCAFGDSAVSAASADSRTARCRAPPGTAPGAVPFRLVDARGAALPGALAYEYLPPASVHALVPSRGPTGGGAVVTLVGTNLLGASPVCRFGDARVAGLDARLISSSSLACVAPPRGAPGAVRVEASTNGGADFTDDRAEFAYEEGPVALALRPSRGLAFVVGQTVTVVGSGFERSGDTACFFGQGAATSGVWLSQSAVRCAVPARRAGMLSVAVGNDRAARSNGLLFETVGLAGPTALEPSRGPISGGTRVVVALAGDLGADSADCVFGDARAPLVLLAVGLSGVCFAPVAATEAAATFRLESRSAQVTLGSTNLAFEYYAPPMIASAQPSRGSLRGGTAVTVRGEGFAAPAGELRCRFGVEEMLGADARALSSTMMVCVSPARSAAAVETLEVSVNGGADFTADGREYLYEAAATVVSVTPSRGLAGSDGQVVTVVGSNFVQTADLSCRFGMSSSSRALFLSSTSVACKAPSRGSGSVQVSVSLSGKDSSDGVVFFEYGLQGTLTRVLPSRGAMAGNTVLTLTSMQLPLSASFDCMIGPRQVPATLLEGDSVRCVTPSSSVAASVSVSLMMDGGNASRDPVVRVL